MNMGQLHRLIPYKTVNKEALKYELDDIFGDGEKDWKELHHWEKDGVYYGTIVEDLGFIIGDGGKRLNFIRAEAVEPTPSGDVVVFVDWKTRCEFKEVF